MKKFTIYFDCLKKIKIAILFYIIYDLLSGILVVITATFFGKFANAVFDMNYTYAMENINKLVLCIICYVLILPGCDFVQDYFCIKKGTEYTMYLNSLFFNKEFVKAKALTAGELEYRLESDGISFYCDIMTITSKIIVTPIVLVYLLYNSLNISLIYTIFTFIISLLNVIVPVCVRKIEAKYDMENREYNEQVNSFVTQITTKPYIIKLFNLHNMFIDKLDKLYIKFLNNTKKKDIKLKTLTGNISSLIRTLSTLIIVLVGAIMLAYGEITAGSILAMIGYLSIFERVINNCNDLIKTIPRIKKVSERLRYFYSDYEKTNGKNFRKGHLIKASNLCFSYSNCKNIINNLNFKIIKGSKTNICGDNGSGKSTLIKIMCGLYKNYSGSIKVNGTELNQISIIKWRNKIAIAMQNPYLFDGTVEENISIGNLDASLDNIENIMRELNILHLRGKHVTSSSNELSGGEKQKISIARALLKGSPILILDEPNNNLDQQTINWLKNFIIKSNKTIIYISHLDDLAECADNVIRL